MLLLAGGVAAILVGIAMTVTTFATFRVRREQLEEQRELPGRRMASILFYATIIPAFAFGPLVVLGGVALIWLVLD